MNTKHVAEPSYPTTSFCIIEIPLIVSSLSPFLVPPMLPLSLFDTLCLPVLANPLPHESPPCPTHHNRVFKPFICYLSHFLPLPFACMLCLSSLIPCNELNNAADSKVLTLKPCVLLAELSVSVTLSRVCLQPPLLSTREFFCIQLFLYEL